MGLFFEPKDCGQKRIISTEVKWNLCILKKFWFSYNKFIIQRSKLKCVSFNLFFWAPIWHHKIFYACHVFDILSVKVETREDEEQNVKMAETVELLLAAGYFRARIKGLSPFDKVMVKYKQLVCSCSAFKKIQLNLHSKGSCLESFWSLSHRGCCRSTL